MKKLFSIICFGLLSISYVAGQTSADAYRYSSEELTGTARYRAMSGAFGALGGDISALSTNPAGSAVFLNSFATITLDHRNSENSVNYFNGLTTSERSDFNFSQAGGVLVFQGNGENPWKKFTLGLNFSETSNFDDNFVARGTSNTSIDEYFLGYADGVPLDLLETVDGEDVTDLYTFLGENRGFGAQQAMLGYQGFIIDPVTTDLENTSYTSAISEGSFAQNYALASTGMNGKLSFNFATQYQDFLYLGVNLNSHFLNYDSTTLFTESNSNSGSNTTYVEFENNLSTTGDGFSFQLGAIAKVNQTVRLGASYESPTWYNIREETTQYLETDNNVEGTTVVYPEAINVYPDYTLKTPGKYTGSLAFLFGGNGLISFDYSYKDYTNMEFRPENDPDFSIQNQDISENFQAVSSYRIGGEYRIQDWSLRGGYRFEESPYKDQGDIGEVTGYSGGLGYSFGAVRLDLAYNKTEYSDSRELYNVGLTNTANIDRDISNFVISLSFGL
jgi:long-subunit fatty acid transport protein